MMPYQHRFVTRARPGDTPRPRLPLTASIGPADIVIVNGDGMRVCQMERISGPLLDGPAPPLLCRTDKDDQTARPVEGLWVTRVGGMLMLGVE